MTQPLLSLQNRDGALPQVYRVNGATPSTLGGTLPSGVVETGTTLDNSFFSNRVIQFQNEVYALAVDGVYKKDDPTTLTGTWTQDHAFTGVATAGQNYHMHGPYQVVINGIPRIYVVWATTAASTWNASMLNGSTDVWSDFGAQSGVVHAATNAWGKQAVYRGVLYMLSDTNIMTFDPGSGTVGVITNSLISQLERAAIGIFNDRLLVLGRNTTTGDIGLHEISAGSLALLFDTPFADGTGAAVSEGKYALFPSPDGSVLYGMWYTSTGGTGWVFGKFIDTAGTLSYDSDLSNPVLPATLRVGGGSGVADNRWWCFYDQETTPGTAALSLFMSVDGASGSTVTNYTFVDEVTVLTTTDAGGSASHAVTNIMTGGGERVYTPGELHIEIVDRVAVLGGEAVRFKCWGDIGAADKNVEFRFNTETEVPLTLATLIGTPTVVSGGGAAPGINLGSKRLTSVEADGVTVYQTVWDIATDGVITGQRVQLVPRIFI